MLMIKCVETCYAWGVNSIIPPLGTLNASLIEYTSHTDNRKIGTSSNRYSEAYIGALWIVPGRTELSFSPDYDKQEVPSMDTPTRYVRGQGKYTGSLGVNKEPGIARWEAAVAGEWDAVGLVSNECNKFILYEFWTFENPDRKDYDVTKCELLTKYYGVTLDNTDKTFEGTFVFTIPLSIVYKEEFALWENGKYGPYGGEQYDFEIIEDPLTLTGDFSASWIVPGGTALNYLEATFGDNATAESPKGAGATLYFGENDLVGTPPEHVTTPLHTRLALQVGETPGFTIRISGPTVYGIWASEDIVIPTVTAGNTYEVITSTYFKDRFTTTCTVCDAASVKEVVKFAPVDHKIRTAFSDWPFLS